MLGVGTHVFEQDTNKNIQAIKEVGLNSVRDDFNWGAVEKEEGKLTRPQKLDLYLQKTLQSNIIPLMVLAYGNDLYDKGGKPVTRQGIDAFVNFARFSASALSGKVNHFEIWNEWDHSAEPVSAKSYFELVKAAAPAIRSINKDAIVLAGAATPVAMRDGWVERLVRRGALQYVDGISIHPYVHCERDNRPEAWIKFVADFSAKLKNANGGKDVALYITEMGWPSHNGACGTPPEKVARYIARALLLVRTLPEVKGIWWYDLKNDGKNIEEREHNFGLLNYDYTPKPAFAALRDIAPVILNGRDFTRLQAPSGLVMVAITDGQGRRSFALWSENGEEAKVSLSVVPAQGGSPSALKVGAGKAGKVSLTQESILTVDGMPQLFTGVRDVRINEVIRWQ